MRPAEACARAESSIIVPSFDRRDFTADVESRRWSNVATVYARVVEESVEEIAVSQSGVHDAFPRAEGDEAADIEELADFDVADSLEAAMCARYLRSDFPEALLFAEKVLDETPDHAVAKLVAHACLAALDAASDEGGSLTERIGSFA